MVAQMTEPILQWISQYGYAGLFAALMLGIAGLPIPDETILIFCGYLIAKGRLDAVTTYFVGFCGSICGISLSYFIGRTGGSAVVQRYGRVVHLTPDRLSRANVWFLSSGELLLPCG